MTETKWFVSVNNQQLPGDHGVEEVKSLMMQHKGSRILVWTTGMAQWSDPATLPQFQVAGPVPPPMVPPPMVPPPYGAPPFGSDEIKKKMGLLGTLFDFSFNHFATLKILPIIYIIMMVVIGLGVLGVIIAVGGMGIIQGIRFSSGTMVFTGLLAIILAPVGGIIYLAIFRIWFEIVIVLFKMKESIDTLAEKSVEKK